jgi:tetratricopeptide (TPR) repeat protein
VNTQPAESSQRTRSTWLIALLIALLTIAVFGGVGRADFVKWDDDINITRNTRIASLDWASLVWMFTDAQQALRYKPLSWVTWALIYAVSGIKPLAYHLVNLLFHALNAGLVYVLIRQLLIRASASERLGKRESNAVDFCAALGALLWAWHPLRVETVAWATALPYDQAVCFTLVSVLCYLQAWGTGDGRRVRLGWYWSSVAAFALALVTYPIVLTFFLVLVALDLHLLRGRVNLLARRELLRPLLWRKVPFVIVTAVPLAVALYARAHALGPWPKAPSLAEFSLSHRVMQACYVWAWYCWKALLPFDLSPVYTRLISFSPSDPLFLGAFAAVLAVTTLLIWRGRQWAGALLLWLAYLVLLVPALGLTEHPHYTSDRYSLLPHIVLAIGVAALLLKLGERGERRWGWLVAAAGVVALCAVLSARQTRVWRNSETLFRHMVSVLGHDSYRAEILWRLGDVLAPQGRITEAKAAYEESVRADPNSASAYNGLGELLAQQGQWRDSLSYFSRALDRQPGFLRALNNIAWTLATAGDATVRNGRQALDLAQALNERSGIRNAQFLETLAAAYAETGEFGRAVATAEQIPAMAKLSGEFEVAARNEKLLPLYRAGQPYRQGR